MFKLCAIFLLWKHIQLTKKIDTLKYQGCHILILCIFPVLFYLKTTYIFPQAPITGIITTNSF